MYGSNKTKKGVKVNLRFFALMLASITLSGCGGSGVLQVSPDTYLIARTSAAGAFASKAGMMKSVIEEANINAKNLKFTFTPFLVLFELYPCISFNARGFIYTNSISCHHHNHKPTYYQAAPALN